MQSSAPFAFLPSAFWLAVGFLVWRRHVQPLLRSVRTYIKNVSTCGFLPPPPSKVAVAFLHWLSRVLSWIQVGKVKIIGSENLKADGPMLIAPNHPHYIDPAIIVLALGRPVRFMAARGVMRFGFGFGSLIAGPCGAFTADLTPGKGGPARVAGVRVLTSGQVLAMFPEGWAYLDGKLGPFKKGAVRIAREAATQIGQAVNIVPVHLRYGRYPGNWIRKLHPIFEYLLVFLAFWYYRRGVTCVIGKPISSSTLPSDDTEATEILKKRIVSLDPVG